MERLGRIAPFALVLMLTFVLAAFAQPAFPETPPDTGVLDWSYIVGKLLTPALYLVVFGTRKLLPRLPRLVVWSLPMVLGPLATQVQVWAMGLDPASVNYWAAGALAIAMNELLSTVKQHGLKG